MKLRPRAFRFLVAVLMLAVVLAALRRPILQSAGWALVSEDAIELADIIIVPEWSHEAGALEAADLVKSGIAPRVAVVTEPLDPAQLEIIRRGVLAQKSEQWVTKLVRSLGVEEVEEISTSVGSGTSGQGEIILDWCLERGLDSLIVVSTPDHSRRLRRVLHRALQGSKTKIMVRVARHSGFDPNRWWETRSGIRTEFIEMEKLFLDIARYPFN